MGKYTKRKRERDEVELELETKTEKWPRNMKWSRREKRKKKKTMLYALSEGNISSGEIVVSML